MIANSIKNLYNKKLITSPDATSEDHIHESDDDKDTKIAQDDCRDDDWFPIKFF